MEFDPILIELSHLHINTCLCITPLKLPILYGLRGRERENCSSVFEKKSFRKKWVVSHTCIQQKTQSISLPIFSWAKKSYLWFQNGLLFSVTILNRILNNTLSFKLQISRVWFKIYTVLNNINILTNISLNLQLGNSL